MRRYPRYERDKGVAFFPTIKSMSNNPYWLMLAQELERKGLFLDYSSPASFDLKYLIDHREHIKILNLHFIQQFYKSSTFIKKIIKLILFTLNMIAARLLGYRTVFTLHNLDPVYDVHPRWLDYLGHWIAINFSERVIVYCKQAQNLLAQKYGRNKSIYFVDHPNVIQWYLNDISRENSRKEINLPMDAVVFAFIGGVKPNKGIDLLINSFKRLDNEKYRLVIAGKAFPPEDYVNSLRQLADQDHRISLFLRHIPDDEMQIYLNAADIIVLPFTKILTSGTANLAMSFGRPVIIPKIGCLPELIEPDCGWLFAPDDLDSLTETMQVAANSSFQEIGLKAYRKLAAFTPERFVVQTLNAYRS
jgi:beta-1,4-mannosyltransferase